MDATSTVFVSCKFALCLRRKKRVQMPKRRNNPRKHFHPTTRKSTPARAKAGLLGTPAKTGVYWGAPVGDFARNAGTKHGNNAETWGQFTHTANSLRSRLPEGTQLTERVARR